MTEKFEFRRLYPVPYKPFLPEGGIPFQKKDWISAILYPPDDARDRRPESRKIDMKTLKVLKRAEDQQVRSAIKPLISINIGAIQSEGGSLGLIKPKIHDYEIEIISTDTKDSQLMITEDGRTERRSLIKFQQHSIYTFVCQNRDGCSCLGQPHRMAVHDWDVNESYGRVIQRTKNHGEIREEMRRTWFDWIRKERETYFMMGTHHRWKSWMVVSVLYLRR